MISDVLSYAEQAIGRYLEDPGFARMYPPGPLRDRIEACRTEMAAIGAILDTPPDKREIAAIVLFKNGKEWDRARVGSDYTLDAARRTVADWKISILREDPGATLVVEERFK